LEANREQFLAIERAVREYFPISWFRLTADVQIIRPSQPAADPLLLLGLRGKITF
jgi:hypothetical protein